jgi:hypothetical protein
MNLLKTISITTFNGFNQREVLVPNGSKVVSVSGLFGFEGSTVEAFVKWVFLVEQSPAKGGIGENIIMLYGVVPSQNIQPLVFNDVLLDVEGANNLSFYLNEEDGLVPISGTIVLSFFS